MRPADRLSFGARVLLACVWLSGVVPMVAVDEARAAAREPTNKEQFLLSELNRARSDPGAWATEQALGVDLSSVEARPPLALNHSLTGSAAYHADEMGAEQYCAHLSTVNGELANKWARDAGYPLTSSFFDAANNIESIACGFGNPPDGSPFQLPLEVLKSLILDDGVPSLGHRKHMLGFGGFEGMREVGAGYESVGTLFRNYWAIHTGYRDVDPVWLTGVVYNDANGNEIYDEGEGLGGVAVQVDAVVIQSGAAGGWSLSVLPGSHPFSCSGAGFAGTAWETVLVGVDNREVDCLSGEALPVVDYGLIPAPEPATMWLQLATLASLFSLARGRRTAVG